MADLSGEKIYTTFRLCYDVLAMCQVFFRTWLSDPRGLLWCDIWLNFRMCSTVHCTVEFIQQDSFLFTKGSKKALSFATTGILVLGGLQLIVFAIKRLKDCHYKFFDITPYWILFHNFDLKVFRIYQERKSTQHFA